MNNKINIKKFHELKDVSKCPEDYLNSVIWAAEFLTVDRTELIDRTINSVFCTHLTMDAHDWWGFDVSEDQKNDWKTVKDLFEKEFGVTADV